VLTSGHLEVELAVSVRDFPLILHLTLLEAAFESGRQQGDDGCLGYGLVARTAWLENTKELA
jgi:hypothetical protein